MTNYIDGINFTNQGVFFYDVYNKVKKWHYSIAEWKALPDSMHYILGKVSHTIQDFSKVEPLSDTVVNYDISDKTFQTELVFNGNDIIDIKTKQIGGAADNWLASFLIKLHKFNAATIILQKSRRDGIDTNLSDCLSAVGANPNDY